MNAFNIGPSHHSRLGAGRSHVYWVT